MKIKSFKPIFCYLSFALCFTSQAFATLTPEQFQWKIFSNRGNIQDLVLLNQEKTLWVSTHGGLEQRDGHTGKLIRVFTHVSSLPVSDGWGGEWGINRLNQLVHLSQSGEWTLYTHDNSGLPDSPINSLASETSSSQTGPILWIGTHRGLAQALSTFNTQGGQVKLNIFDMNNSPLPDNFVRVLISDERRGVWLETRHGDYVHFDGNQQWTIVETTRPELPEPPTRLFSGDEQGGLWLYGGSYHSEAPLVHLSSSGQLVVHKPMVNTYGNSIETFISDGQGGLWIGSGVGQQEAFLVTHLNEQGEWKFYASPLPTASWYGVRALARDLKGGLWVGISNSLYYLTSQGTWNIDQLIGASGTEWFHVNALASDSQGGVWAGSWSGEGLVHLKEDGLLQKFEMGLPNPYINQFTSDGIGGIWLLLSEGVAHLSQQDDEWTMINAQNSYLSSLNPVEYFVHDGNGGLCVGESSHHLHITMQEVKVFSFLEQLPNTCLENLNQSTNHQYVTDEKGNLWEVVYNGLAHQNSQGQRTIFNQNNSPLPRAHINALASDGEGGVWVACGDNSQQGGLAHVSAEGQWFVFTRDNSELPNNDVENIISDSQGGLWIKTSDEVAHRLAHLFVRQPTVKLPELGMQAHSRFAGGVSKNGQTYQTQMTVTPTDRLTVKGEITTDPDHVGITTDLVVYASVLHGQDTLFVMLDKKGGLQVWDQQWDHLVAFKENVVLQTQQSLLIYQGSLTTLGLKKVFFGYRLVDGKTVVSPTGIEIQVSLPVLGTAIDISKLHLPTSSSFYGGTSVNGQAYQAQVVQKLTDHAQITGDITIETAHVGQVADIVVYAETGSPLSVTPTYFMLGEGGNILLWDQQTAHLIPFMQQVTLETVQHLSIYQGPLYFPGKLKVFFGYRLSDGTTIVNTQGIEIRILE